MSRGMVVALLLAATATDELVEQQALIREATRVEVVRVSTDKGYPEQGKPIELKGPLATRARDVFAAKGLVDPNRHSLCMFSPGVKYRFTRGDKKVSVLVCFLCHEISVTQDETLSFEPAYTAILRLTKKALPADRVIQAIEEATLPQLDGVELGAKAEVLGPMVDGKPKLVPVPDELFRSLKRVVMAPGSYVINDPTPSCIGPEPDIAVRLQGDGDDAFITLSSTCGTVAMRGKGVSPLDGTLRMTPELTKLTRALKALDR
jgi:hypothetical protein